MKKRLADAKKHMRYLRRRAKAAREGGHMRRWRKTGHEIIKQQKTIQLIEARNREGVDISYGRPSPESLKADGKSFVCMYLNNIPGFGMTREDVKRYSEAGLDIVSIFEKGQEEPKLGHKVGKAHAQEAIELAREVHMPQGRPIYFASDFEARGPETGPYYVGVREELHEHNDYYSPGAYGDKVLMEWLWRNRLIVAQFQTYAWSHHEWSKEAHLKQVLITLPGAELKIGGAYVDHCKSTHLDFGQWRIEKGKPITPDITDIANAKAV